MRWLSPSISPKPRGQYAVTLAELLVVVGLLCVGLLLLLPALTRVSSASRNASCVHHLRQIGVALSQYAACYQNWQPWYSKDNTTDLAPWGKGHFLWQDSIYEFIAATGYPSQVPRTDGTRPPSALIFRCPAMTQGLSAWSGYALNGAALTNVDMAARGLPARPLSRQMLFSRRAGRLFPLNEPGKTAWVIDSDAVWFRRTKKEYDSLAWRHYQGANVLFYDGHVEWVAKPDASDLNQPEWLRFFGDFE